MSTLSKQDIERLFQLLNKELRSASISGEVYLVGGAVMCLVFGARESTRIGEEFQDLDDIRYLLRHIGLRKYEDALETIANYYPLGTVSSEGALRPRGTLARQRLEPSAVGQCSGFQRFPPINRNGPVRAKFLDEIKVRISLSTWGRGRRSRMLRRFAAEIRSRRESAC